MTLKPHPLTLDMKGVNTENLFQLSVLTAVTTLRAVGSGGPKKLTELAEWKSTGQFLEETSRYPLPPSLLPQDKKRERLFMLLQVRQNKARVRESGEGPGC